MVHRIQFRADNTENTMRRRTFLTFAAGTAIGSAVTSYGREIAAWMPNWASKQEVPVIDLHFGTMRGTGWLTAEQPNWDKVVSTAIHSGPTLSHPTSLTVADTTGFCANQLVCLQTADGEYRSATINEIKGHTFRLRQPLEANISPGSLVQNFLSNDAHPTQFGYYTIADDTLRQLADKPSRVLVNNGFPLWQKLGECRFSENRLSEYGNPGTDDVENYSLLVEADQAGSGIVSREFNLGVGAYRVTLPIAVAGATHRGAHLQLVAKRKSKQLGVSSFLTFDGISPVTLDFNIKRPGPVRILLVLAMGGLLQMSVGQLEIQRKYAYSMELNNGNHLLYGDSWVNAGHITRRLQQRLSNAKISQSGVGGNTLASLLTRFDTDVPKHKPDWVWVLCGTNDVYQMLTPAEFQSRAIELREKIRAIGARPIFWNPSVCNLFYENGDRLAPSRKLAVEVDYNAPHSA